jgi:hypothetical protein
MRRLVTFAATVAFFASLALAETWNGKLIDASCMDQQKAAATCNPSSTTTAFAIQVEGKMFRLDQAGNAKAADALKNRADRSADPNAPAPADVSAKITGTKDGETIKVDTVEVK